MNLQYISETQQIVATDSLISEYASNPLPYTSVEMSTALTCNSQTIAEYPTSDISNTNNKFYLSGNFFIIQPEMFNCVNLVDGVYRVDIKFKDAEGYTRIYNCIFIDVTFKCRVASLLSSLTEADSPSATVHLLHYSLVNGSNCGCECDEMCTNFNALKAILDNQPAKATDCGCN